MEASICTNTLLVACMHTNKGGKIKIIHSHEELKESLHISQHTIYSHYLKTFGAGGASIVSHGTAQNS